VGLDLTVVDAFTDRPFAGNPAAVAVVGSAQWPGGYRRPHRTAGVTQAALAFVT
jgi:predicted PhzF superfamily epimerase YddE/YHI9